MRPDFVPRNLRILCMPYGTVIDRIQAAANHAWSALAATRQNQAA
jgi:hypothetical protein